MSLTLYVDGDRWRRHLREVADAHPRLVPVAKGNGYGLGLGRLARRAQWLGSDLLAVGTYTEVPEVVSRFSGDVLVLSPWRPFLPEVVSGPRVVHTVGRLEDLAALAALPERPRVVLEGLTSMRRHGLTPADFTEAVGRCSGVRLEGVALHLPMPGAGESRAEVESWLRRITGLPAPARRVLVSHLSFAELDEVTARHPDLDLRPRIGTALWLGDRAALAVRAAVLDVHQVRRGDRVGYRQRRISRDGVVVVVSGGTAHGVGLTAPTSAAAPRQRASALSRGGLDAAGLALSPFRIGGRRRWFVEPPHMQVSLVFVPRGTDPPVVGDELDVDVRLTTTTVDRVVVS